MPTNAEYVERARRVIPGGVNSSNRILPWALAATEASGAYFTDAEGMRYLDYHAAFGPLILGHNHPRVNAAVRDVLDRLDIVGVGITEGEVALAEKLAEHIPSAERILLTNSGSEATYAALRLARGVTGRNTIIKFQGTYHGWHDAVLMNVISAPDKIGQRDPLSLGMLPEVVDHTIVLPFNDIEDVIRPLTRPLHHGPVLAVLHGNLAPRGALLRITTASAALTRHRGPALVFDSYGDMLARIDDPHLPVTRDTVLVLRNAGAVGVPGLPEWGAIPIPKKLLQMGVRDMLRISDSRMSGTSSGTIVLHVAPEAAAGGPLALVRDGDLIDLDLDQRRLELLVNDAELQQRMEDWTPPRLHPRGYPRMYAQHVLQPDQGCDFGFLRPTSPDDLDFIPPIVGRS